MNKAIDKKSKLRSGSASRQTKVTTSQTLVSYDDFASWIVVSQEITTEENSSDCPEIVTPTPPIYKWDTGNTCSGCDKYTVSSQTVSYDNGENYIPTGIEYTDFVEANSTYCGCGSPSSPIYKWDESGTTCIGYDKYKIYAQKVSYDGGLNYVYTGAVNKELLEVHSSDCTDVPPDGEYRWVTDTGCTRFDFYEIRTQQRLNKETGVWENTGGVDRKLIEVNSEHCGYAGEQSKWVIVEYFCNEENCDRFQKEVLKTCAPTSECSCSEERCWQTTDDYRDTLIRQNSPMCYEPYRVWIESEPIEPLEPIEPVEPQRYQYDTQEEYEAAHAQWEIDHAQWQTDWNYWHDVAHPQWEIDHQEWWEEHIEWWNGYDDYATWKQEQYSSWKLEDKELHPYPATACDAYELTHEKWKSEEPEDKESLEHSAWEGNEPPYTVCCGPIPDKKWIYYEGCCEDDYCGCNLTIESGKETMEFSGGTISFAIGNKDCGYYAYEKEYELINDEWKPTGEIRHPDTKEIGVRKVLEESSTICCSCPGGESVRWIADGWECDESKNKRETLKKQINNGEYDEHGNLNWEDAVPEETKPGAIIEENSTDCGYSCTFTLKTNGTTVKFYNPETTPETLLDTITVVDEIAAYSTSVTTRYLIAEPSRVGYIFNPSTINIWCGEMKELNGEAASRWTADTGCCEVVKETCNCSLTIQSGSEMMDYTGGTVIFKLGSADCNLYEFEREEIQDEHGEWIPTGEIRNVKIKQLGSSVCCP